MSQAVKLLEIDPTATDTAALLGGRDTLGGVPDSAVSVHDMIVAGLPASALRHLLDGLLALPAAEVLDRGVGISLRTYQRQREHPDRPLDAELGGRLWQFAEILALAIRVLGSRAEAEGWMGRPALALDGRRPIDLVATPAGAALVERQLLRMEYGVYA